MAEARGSAVTIWDSSSVLVRVMESPPLLMAKSRVCQTGPGSGSLPNIPGYQDPTDKPLLAVLALPWMQRDYL